MFSQTLAVVGAAFGGIFGMVPLWKSAVLSPDSIMRRCFWTGGVLLLIAVLLIPSAWPGRIFGAVVTALAWAAIGVRCRHIKICRRVISTPLDPPRPDRSPALSPHREEWEL